MLRDFRFQLSLGVVLALATVSCALFSLNQAAPAHAGGANLVVSKETASGGLGDPGISVDTYCSLPEAVQAARTNSVVADCGPAGDPGIVDIIHFESAASTLTFNLAATLDANSGGPLLIDNQNANAVNISGNGVTSILTVGNSQIVGLTNVTLTNGLAPNVGCGGGAIVSSGDITLDHVTLLNNTSNSDVASVICSTGGSVSITDSSIFNNFTGTAGSTIVLGSGTHTITNSIISENTGGNWSGVFDSGGTVNVTNSTINATDGGILVAAQGGATFNLLNDTLKITGPTGIVQNLGTVNAKNTIFSSETDCGSAITTDQGNNLDTGNTCGLNTNLGSLINADPKLSAFPESLGGPTTVFELLAGSEAIDTGTNSGCPATDQRGAGFTRPKDGDSNGTATCDMGAFEADEGTNPTPSPTPLVTDSPTPSPTATASPTPTPTGSATPTPTAAPSPTPTMNGTATPTPVENLYVGDINCDGVVDMADFNLLLLYVAELWDGSSGLNGCPSVGQNEPLSGFDWGDVNCDGFVNTLDTLLILAYTVDITMDPAIPSCAHVGDLLT
jgi:hypothetical protein